MAYGPSLTNNQESSRASSLADDLGDARPRAATVPSERTTWRRWQAHKSLRGGAGSEDQEHCDDTVRDAIPHATVLRGWVAGLRGWEVSTVTSGIGGWLRCHPGSSAASGFHRSRGSPTGVTVDLSAVMPEKSGSCTRVAPHLPDPPKTTTATRSTNTRHRAGSRGAQRMGKPFPLLTDY